MHRIKSLRTWKKPHIGNQKHTSCYCLSDHFHRSGLEGRVCDELRLRKIAKDIKDYRREVDIVLMEGEVNVSKFIGKYRADFIVENFDGSQEIIEAKGIAWPDFKRKWKVLEKMYANDPLMALTIIRR